MKVYTQKTACAWGSTASLAANACTTSGSFNCQGWARLTGILATSGSLKAASGLLVRQSVDKGSHFDYEYSGSVSACGASSYSIEIVGDTAEIQVRIGANDADELRTKWFLRPI